MMINQDHLTAIKEQIDLAQYIRESGVELKQNGTNLQGLCPFHSDSKPSLSVNPGEKLWNCFGCEAGGDIIRFVELFDKLSFREAVKKLSSHLGNTEVKKTKPKKKAKEKALDKNAKKLLARVVTHYQHTMFESANQAGREYLNARGINDIKAMKAFGAGFVDGSLLAILPDDPQVINQLKELGILNKRGKETFYNCVIFPLTDRGNNPTGLYGRNIAEHGPISHLYLPGPRKGLVNHKSLGRGSTVLLTESIIDALSLYDQGFTNVLPTYSAGSLSEELLDFLSERSREAYLVFDNDEAGRNGAAKAAEQLGSRKITTHLVSLPEKDVNIFFKRHTPEEFEQLLRDANPESVEQSGSLEKRKQTLYREEAHGFMVAFAKRYYQVKGIQRSDTQLKATIKVSLKPESTKDFELTTIDLYSSRSRSWFAKLCAGLFQEVEELIKEDLARLLTLVEEWQAPRDKEEPVEISKEDERQAMAFLQDPELSAHLLSDFDILGITGERTNKLVGYLAATSRKLADPLSVLIQSRSAAGKSTLQDAILSLIPPEEYIKYTRITDQALFYKDENSMVHKILAIEEAEGMGGAAYSIRNIQSAKKITVAATGKDPGTGKMKTEEYTVKGPVCVMITTTATDVDQETASRFLFLTIDESAGMTEAIHRMQRHAETLEGLIGSKKREKIISKHQAAQRLLRPLSVVNPYSSHLTYPSQSLRSRRDHKKYLGLIRAVAFLRQFQKEVKSVEVEGEPVHYIEVSLDDIATANQLAGEVLGQSLDELAKPSRTLLVQIQTMIKELSKKQGRELDKIFFTRRMIRDHTGWTDWQVRTHIKQLEELEYVHARVGSRGKEYAYVLHYQGEEGEKCYLDLADVEEIRKQLS